MSKIMLRLVPIFFALFSFTAGAVESLQTYVDTCKSELGFTKLPELNCAADGLHFAGGNGAQTLVNDYVGFRRVGDMVDLAFACRWLSPDKLTVAGAEMIVHNRANGNTCFFSAKLTGDIESASASATLISPTASNAATYWDAPAELKANVRCVNCHVAGPYIITQRIAPFMARFGLMNNGHDTKGLYHVVGTTFSQFDSIIAGNIGTLNPNDPLRNCANACHVLGGRSTQERRLGRGTDFELQFSPNDGFIKDTAKVMPPKADSDYRWVNIDTPNSTGDYETLTKVQAIYPQFTCANPTMLEAHVVDNERTIDTNNYFDNVLNPFNLKEGLYCSQAEQPAGMKCKNYYVTYQCGNGDWTSLESKSSPTKGGDNELRKNITNLCKDKGEPTAMIAAYNLGDDRYPRFVMVNAPNDRLSQFNSKGLVCKNADQIDGKCSNYTVRFACP